MTVGKKLKSFREGKKLSQEKVAEVLHISRQTVSKWELGKSLPDFESLMKLAVLFDFSLDELFDLPAEREKSMATYTEDQMIAAIQQKVKGDTLTDPEQDAFIADHIITPFLKEYSDLKVYYVTIQKQLLSILVNEPVRTELAKAYLTIFDNDCSDYWFVTDKGIFYFNIISFLQEGTVTFRAYQDLDYLCVGRQYAAMDITQNNQAVIGVFSQDKAYNWAFIAEEDIPDLLHVFAHLSEAKPKLVVLSDYGLLAFIKKWQKGKLVRV